MRVLLDANVLLRTLLPSANPFRAVALIFQALLAGHFTLLLPRELIDEIFDTASNKPYFAARINAEQTNAFVGSLEEAGEVIPELTTPAHARSRDPDDDDLFAHAAAGRADYLVSDDADILTVDASGLPFAVVSTTEFLAVPRARGPIEPTHIPAT